MADLLSGAVDMTITTPPPLLGQIAAGKLRPLAVTGKTRLASLTDVPTAAEAGYPDLIVSSWFAMYAPANTPKAVVDKLSGEIEKIMKTDEFRKKAAEQGADAEFMGPEQLDKYHEGRAGALQGRRRKGRHQGQLIDRATREQRTPWPGLRDAGQACGPAMPRFPLSTAASRPPDESRAARAATPASGWPRRRTARKGRRSRPPASRR